MIRHFIGALEMERVGCSGTGHAHFLHNRLILPPPKQLVINHYLSSSSDISLVIIRNVKVPSFFRKLRHH